jgi:TPR repeat protein
MSNAVISLAYLLYSGLGIATDKERAVKVWRLAAYAGQSEAQWHLGVAFEQGAGVQPDRVKAYGWYRCAIETASRRYMATTRKRR